MYSLIKSSLQSHRWLVASLALVTTLGLATIRIGLAKRLDSRTSFIMFDPLSSLKTSTDTCDRKFGSCGTVPDLYWPFVNSSVDTLIWDYPSTSTKLPPTHFTELVRDAFAKSNISDWKTFYSELKAKQTLALGRSQLSKQLCYMNLVNISYRNGKTGEQPMYATITLEETCLLNDRDWVHFEFIPIGGAPTVNEDAYVAYPSKGIVAVEIPCLGIGGEYLVSAYYQAPNCLGSTRCSGRFAIGNVYQFPIANLTISIAGISKSTGDTHACQLMSNKVPFGLGFWSHNQKVWNSYCNKTSPALPIKDESIMLHLVGDSTMEELVSALTVNGTLKGHAACGGNEKVSGRPCHSYYTSTSRGVAFTFTLLTEPFGWRTKNNDPQIGNTVAPWNSASLLETCTFITKVREQSSDKTRHIVLFNYGLHGVFNHGVFRLAYEQALVSLQKNLGYFADIIAVGISPTNPTRKTYEGMDCRSEVNVAKAREIIECVASRHGIPVLDRTMMQFGLWSLYKDYVHLGSTRDAYEFRHFIVDEYVRAAVYVARAS